MKEFSIPFSLFDFFAILLPGAVGAFGLYLFANPALTAAGHQAIVSKTVFEQITDPIAVVTGLVMFSYLLGQVLNAVSEMCLDRPANMLLGWSASELLAGLGLSIDRGLKWTGFQGKLRFPIQRQYEWAASDQVSDIGRLLRNCVEKKFGQGVFEHPSYTFGLVQAAVREHMKEAAATSQIYIATAVMFQSLVVAMLLIGAALVWGYATRQVAATSLVGNGVLGLGLALIFFFSYRRYKRMWANAVYVAFVVWAKEASPASN